ncbi:MAG: hypothetical protein IPK75_16760 [Acidobacteria bacterium]|nr:hypothetical protein [Acidobacteriota bacterium]
MIDVPVSHIELLIGFIIEATAPFEAWHERLIRELRALPGVQIACVILDPARRRPAFASSLEQAAFQIDNLVTRRRGAQARPDWRGVQIDAGAAVCDRPLDIMLDLRAEAGELSQPVGEVWTVDFLRGPASPERTGMQMAVTSPGAFPIALEARTASGYQTIDQAVCASRRSAARNLEQAQQVIVAMILRTLRARLSGAQVRAGRANAQDALTLQAPGAAPKDQALLFAGNFVSYAAARGADTLSKRVSAWSGMLSPHFRLYHGRGSPLDFSPGEAEALSSSRKHYLADPFLFRRDGRLWAFFEVFDYVEDTGSIGVAELTHDGLGPVSIVMSGGGHLSYPHVFEYAGEIYMMPECCARRRVEIWRAVNFPFEWELVSSALEGAYAVDSNLHFDGAKWWLFTNAAFDPSVDAGLELSVYEADGPLLKRLEPHARNPVVADARYARNGGRVFWKDGKLYRPAQSLEYGQYGYGLYLMEILRLSHSEYEERPVRFIRGCHHVDSNGEDVIFDLRRGVSGVQATAMDKAR